MEWEGNIPSPGGVDRLYFSKFSGSGIMLQQPDKSIVWQINYVKTGFLAEQYQGEFRMYKCD